VRQIEIKAMARRAEVRDRRDILGDLMPAALQREQRWLLRMITDGCFALMTISSCYSFTLAA
jgi:hypothetical protein